jgi:adhesin/invasin
VFTGQIAGTSATVAASVGGVPVTTTPPTLTVIPGAASAVASVVMASAGTVASNTGATLTLIAKDAFGNQLISGGDAISFAAGGGTSTGNIGTAVDNGDGTYTATFTGILAGTATTVGAAVNGQNVTTAQPTITVVPGAAANVAIQAGNGQFALPLFSVAIAPAVIVTDNHGNPVPGVSVTFAVTLGGGVVLPTSAISTGTDGVARVVAWTLGLLGNQRLRATASVGNVTFTAETLLSLE